MTESNELLKFLNKHKAVLYDIMNLIRRDKYEDIFPLLENKGVCTTPEEYGLLFSWFFEKIPGLTLDKFLGAVHQLPAHCFEYTKFPSNVISIPGNIDLVSSFVFANSNVHEITGGEGITYLEESAFSDCPDLVRVNLEASGIISVPDSCFSNCPKLKEIILPESCIKMGFDVINNSDNVVIYTKYRGNASNQLSIPKREVSVYKGHLRFIHNNPFSKAALAKNEYDLSAFESLKRGKR